MIKKNYNESKIIRYLGTGIESDVYLYDDEGIKTALKIFKDEKVLDNKELKLELLKEEKLLLKETKLLSKIYRDDRFIGYTSLYDQSEPLINYFNRSKKVKLDLLTQIQQKYQELNKREIFIGDFNLENFRVKNGKVRLIDIDNFSIDGLPFDVKDQFMEQYFSKCSKIDNIDFYSFNFLALSFMAGIIPSVVLETMNISNLPNEFNNDRCKKIFTELMKINDDYKRTVIVNDDGFNDATFIKCMKKGLFK